MDHRQHESQGLEDADNSNVCHYMNVFHKSILLNQSQTASSASPTIHLSLCVSLRICLPICLSV